MWLLSCLAWVKKIVLKKIEEWPAQTSSSSCPQSSSSSSPSSSWSQSSPTLSLQSSNNSKLFGPSRNNVKKTSFNSLYCNFVMIHPVSTRQSVFCCPELAEDTKHSPAEQTSVFPFPVLGAAEAALKAAGVDADVGGDASDCSCDDWREIWENYYSSHNWEIILQNESAAKIKLSQKLSFESQFTFQSKVPPTKKHCKNSGGRS